MLLMPLVDSLIPPRHLNNKPLHTSFTFLLHVFVEMGTSSTLLWHILLLISALRNLRMVSSADLTTCSPSSTTSTPSTPTLPFNLTIPTALPNLTAAALPFNISYISITPMGSTPTTTTSTLNATSTGGSISVGGINIGAQNAYASNVVLSSATSLSIHITSIVVAFSAMLFIL